MKTKNLLYYIDDEHILHTVDSASGLTACGNVSTVTASLHEFVPSTFTGKKCEICFPESKEKKASFTARDVEVIQEPKSVRGRII